MLDPRCWWIARILGRNPLLRRADRIEALVMFITIVVVLVAIPAAGVAGASVYGARHSRYVQEAGQRHAVVAAVTATGVDRVDATVVQARWPVAAGERTGPIALTRVAKVGERVQIWIDKDGNPVASPTPTWRAVSDAVRTLLVIVLATGFGMASLVIGVRSRLDRAREAEWEREIRSFQEDEGRTNQR